MRTRFITDYPNLFKNAIFRLKKVEGKKMRMKFSIVRKL